MTTSAGGWTVDLVGVTPRQNTAPDREVLAPLTVSNIGYVDDLDGPGTAQLDVAPGTFRLAEAQRLVDLGFQRVDVEVTDPDGTLRWAGKVRSVSGDPTSWSLRAASHEALLDGYGLVDAEETYSQVDQHFIVRDVIDALQARDWGHLGLDTTTIAASGVLRDRTWAINENTGYGTLLRRLSEVINGFDMWITPGRLVRCAYPKRGIDRSGDVVIAAPAIRGGQVDRSIAPGDFATEVLAIGTSDGNNPPLLSLVANVDARQRHGIIRHTVSADSVTEQATLDGIADEALAQRLSALVVPTGDLLPVVGVDLDAFDVGDTIGWSFDAGAGLESFQRRVRRRSVSVADDGLTIKVALA